MSIWSIHATAGSEIPAAGPSASSPYFSDAAAIRTASGCAMLAPLGKPAGMNRGRTPGRTGLRNIRALTCAAANPGACGHAAREDAHPPQRASPPPPTSISRRSPITPPPPSAYFDGTVVAAPLDNSPASNPATTGCDASGRVLFRPAAEHQQPQLLRRLPPLHRLHRSAALQQRHQYRRHHRLPHAALHAARRLLALPAAWANQPFAQIEMGGQRPQAASMPCSARYSSDGLLGYIRLGVRQRDDQRARTSSRPGPVRAGDGFARQSAGMHRRLCAGVLAHGANRALDIDLHRISLPENHSRHLFAASVGRTAPAAILPPAADLRPGRGCATA